MWYAVAFVAGVLVGAGGLVLLTLLLRRYGENVRSEQATRPSRRDPETWRYN